MRLFLEGLPGRCCIQKKYLGSPHQSYVHPGFWRMTRLIAPVIDAYNVSWGDVTFFAHSCLQFWSIENGATEL